MTTLCWFQPQADPPRRAFFIRAPEAMGQKPYNLEGDDGNGGALHEDIVRDIFRMAVNRWAIEKHAMTEPADHLTIPLIGVLMQFDDGDACAMAHKFADALGIEP